MSIYCNESHVYKFLDHSLLYGNNSSKKYNLENPTEGEVLVCKKHILLVRLCFFTLYASKSFGTFCMFGEPWQTAEKQGEVRVTEAQAALLRDLEDWKDRCSRHSRFQSFSALLPEVVRS